ncbi:hypothetical protein OE88DRAFT_1627204 [Heliocybe sulcata]|uniref:Uncharacterized protein n=1 Tax=Heliocybe sulcata TaxID=5364 RepID=A0A5C3NHU6_9AGAM|nr:hypothetical protein OE88DRAFT_1627204 [Heliocybe sulcata]
MDAAAPSFSTLPTELLLQILGFSLSCHPTPSSILCLNYPIYVLSFPLLYEHVRFHSTRGMSEFAQLGGEGSDSSVGQARLRAPVRIRTITVEKVNEYGVFDALKSVFERTVQWQNAFDAWESNCRLDDAMERLDLGSGFERGREKIQQVELEELSLCLHSHTRNPRLEAVYEALALVNPTKFTWTGPDPDHHFSTAIVPQATFHLFQAVRHWSHLTHLKLTNIAFPNFSFPDIVFAHPSILTQRNAATSPVAPEGYPLPRKLKAIYIGQATFVPAELIARFACSEEEGAEGVQEIRLVDVYVQSIWERRMRRGDVEIAAVELLQYEEMVRKCEEEVVKRVRAVVRCEAKTERIMGGDRVERVGVLE